jgi:hypothetical protein
VLHWSPTSHCAPAVHVWSENASAPALPPGPHLATHVDPVGHACAQPNKKRIVQSVRKGVPVPVHAPPWQVCVEPQLVHALPPVPHALVVVPARHVVPLQQPEHDVVSHSHVPDTQR